VNNRFFHLTKTRLPNNPIDPKNVKEMLSAVLVGIVYIQTFSNPARHLPPQLPSRSWQTRH